MDVTEEMSRRGNYKRTIFVRAPKNSDTMYSERGDILQSTDPEPSQDIFTRVHFCFGGDVVILLRRGASDNPFEVSSINEESTTSLDYAMAYNIDHLAYSSFAWCGRRWIDQFEMPDAIKKIEHRVEEGVRLVDISFQLSDRHAVPRLRPCFVQGIVTLEPDRDWIFRGIRIPDSGTLLPSDATKRVFFTSSVDYDNYDGMWLPTERIHRRIVKDEDGTVIDDSGDVVRVVDVRLGPVPDERFDMKTYGLGSLVASTTDDSQWRIFVLVAVNVFVLGTIGIILVQRRRRMN